MLLWKYGGFSIDTSVVTRLSIEKQKNFLCLNEEAMKFDEKKIVEILINNALKNFEGSAQSAHITNFASKSFWNLCKSHKEDCEEFNLMPEQFCNPLSNDLRKHLFDANMAENLLETLDAVSIIRLWNEHTNGKKNWKEIVKKAPKLIKEICPNTFGAVEEK